MRERNNVLLLSTVMIGIAISYSGGEMNIILRPSEYRCLKFISAYSSRNKIPVDRHST